jgi:tRNA-binding protein
MASGEAVDLLEAFALVEVRVGTVRAVEAFPNARKPAYKLEIDFGPRIGVKRSSAQITENYTPAELVGRQVVAAVNLPPKRIAGFVSECLVTGFADAAGHVVLCAPERAVPDGGRLY